MYLCILRKIHTQKHAQTHTHILYYYVTKDIMHYTGTLMMTVVVVEELSGGSKRIGK